MRLTVICGLDHIPAEQRNEEARRALADLAKQIYTEAPPQLKAGSMFIIRDIQGNRIGVCDITEH